MTEKISGRKHKKIIMIFKKLFYKKQTQRTHNQSVNINHLLIFQNSLKILRELLDVQCMNGNWNYDPYMHGMANGMILALSLFDNKQPEYLKTPKIWLRDLPIKDKSVVKNER